jgi:carbonic anhydrase
MKIDALIGRRKFFRLGALAALAGATPVLFGRDLAQAQAPEVCNPNAPATPSAALQAWMDGNGDWASGNPQHPGLDAIRRACLANNPQTPFASILSCSDSRCPPEILFDQGLGDLFVARVAGNTASGRLIDSLLYGTSVLGTRLLFVLGHSSCGAVAAAVDTFPKPIPKLPFVKLIFPAVKQARRIVKRHGGNPNDRNLTIPITTNQNVVLTVRELKRYFQLGDNEIAGGVYDLGNQKVTLAVDMNV